MIYETLPVYFKKWALAGKSAVNMSDEIQPKKIWLAEKWAVFFKSQPNFAKKNSVEGLRGWHGFFLLLLVFGIKHTYSKNHRVYWKETWHTDTGCKPHLQCHINITSVPFSALAGALNQTRVGKFCYFWHLCWYISELVQDSATVTIICYQKVTYGLSTGNKIHDLSP